jgi:hypothetical protein
MASTTRYADRRSLSTSGVSAASAVATKPALPPKPKLTLNTEPTSKSISHVQNNSKTISNNSEENQVSQEQVMNYNNIINSLKEKIKQAAVQRQEVLNDQDANSVGSSSPNTKKSIDTSCSSGTSDEETTNNQANNNMVSLLDEIYAEIEENKHILGNNKQSISQSLLKTLHLDVSKTTKDRQNVPISSGTKTTSRQDSSSNYSTSSSSSYSCSSSTYSSSSIIASHILALQSNQSKRDRATSHVPPLPSVPPPPLATTSNQTSIDSESSDRSFKRISLSLEEEIEMEIRNKLNISTKDENSTNNKNSLISDQVNSESAKDLVIRRTKSVELLSEPNDKLDTGTDHHENNNANNEIDNEDDDDFDDEHDEREIDVADQSLKFGNDAAGDVYLEPIDVAPSLNLNAYNSSKLTDKLMSRLLKDALHVGQEGNRDMDSKTTTRSYSSTQNKFKNIESLFMSPSKLKSYLIKTSALASPHSSASKTNPISSTGSASLSSSSLSAVTPLPACSNWNLSTTIKETATKRRIDFSGTGTLNRHSLSYLLKTNKITSTIRMIKSRNSTNSAASSPTSSSTTHGASMIHQLFSNQHNSQPTALHASSIPPAPPLPESLNFTQSPPPPPPPIPTSIFSVNSTSHVSFMTGISSASGRSSMCSIQSGNSSSNMSGVGASAYKKKTSSNSKREQLRRQTTIVQNALVSTNVTKNASAIQISQPRLISQTFDMSKQNLIEIKPTTEQCESNSGEEQKSQNVLCSVSNAAIQMQYSSYSSFSSSASDTGSMHSSYGALSPKLVKNRINNSNNNKQQELANDQNFNHVEENEYAITEVLDDCYAQDLTSDNHKNLEKLLLIKICLKF